MMETISQRAPSAPAPLNMNPARSTTAALHDKRIKRYPCSTCGQQWSSPRVQKGTRHRGCKGSPDGFFGIAPLSEKPPKGA